MPSGEQHAWYATSFREIDWLDLYERRDGYLLFEDLKAQWEQFVKPEWEFGRIRLSVAGATMSHQQASSRRTLTRSRPSSTSTRHADRGS